MNRKKIKKRKSSKEKALKYLRIDLAECEKRASKPNTPEEITRLAEKHSVLSSLIHQLQKGTEK